MHKIKITPDSVYVHVNTQLDELTCTVELHDQNIHIEPDGEDVKIVLKEFKLDSWDINAMITRLKELQNIIKEAHERRLANDKNTYFYRREG
jgi:hypothetical protein